MASPETRYVIWVMPIDSDYGANTPREAAEAARKIQLDPESAATVFNVATDEQFQFIESVLRTGTAEIDLDVPAAVPT